jgi:hypothetical protein
MLSDYFAGKNMPKIVPVEVSIVDKTPAHR